MGQGKYCDCWCPQCQAGWPHCYTIADPGAYQAHSRGCHTRCDPIKCSRRAEIDGILPEAEGRYGPGWARLGWK
jgi:hypothetical protein